MDDNFHRSSSCGVALIPGFFDRILDRDDRRAHKLCNNIEDARSPHTHIHESMVDGWFREYHVGGWKTEDDSVVSLGRIH